MNVNSVHSPQRTTIVTFLGRCRSLRFAFVCDDNASLPFSGDVDDGYDDVGPLLTTDRDRFTTINPFPTMEEKRAIAYSFATFRCIVFSIRRLGRGRYDTPHVGPHLGSA